MKLDTARVAIIGAGPTGLGAAWRLRDVLRPHGGVVILARQMGFQVAEVPVTHVARRGGTQSLKGLTRWAQVGFLCARQLVWLRLRYREGPAPARQPAA